MEDRPMKGILLAVHDSYDRRVDSWCVTRDGRRLHVIAVYGKQQTIPVTYQLKSVQLGGCQCQPLEELPTEVSIQAEQLWPKG